MSPVEATEIDVTDYPYSPVGIEARIPVVVELPADVYAAVRTRYESVESGDQDFADYLCDVIVFEPTYTVEHLDGVVDEHSGRLADPDNETNANGGDTE